MIDRFKAITSFWPVLFLFATSGVAADAVKPGLAGEVLPVLERHCWGCHGASKQRGGLRLDSREGALAGGDGGPAVVPGKAAESRLLKMIRGEEGAKKRMPLDSAPLTDEETALLEKWIDAGALYPAGLETARVSTDHWAFQPIRRVDPPTVRNGTGIRNPIDKFIVARLEKEGLTPSPEANRATLIRRAYLDLIGLPPSVEAVDAFVNDPSPDAFKRVVDALLDNPHYGERWGRHWLDQARFADSHGYTFDNPRVMWPYRDWVIKAINDDMPFDRFTVEQLAGDLLPNPTTEQFLATGFHRNTLIAQEGGTDHEQFRVESVIDRVNTTGAVWLGLTVGCAQCHSHKYDPITQREYYNLYAFFNTTEDVNNVGPTVRIRPAGYEAREREVSARLKASQADLDAYDREHASGQAAWEAAFLGREPSGEVWTRLDPADFSTRGGADIRKLGDKSLLVGPKHPQNDVYSVKATTGLKRVTAVRLDTLTDDSLPKKGPGLAGNGNFVMTGFEFKVGGKAVKLIRAAADHTQPKFDPMKLLDGDKTTGWAINVGKGSKKKMNEPHWAWFIPEEPVELGGETLEFVIRHESERNRNYMVGRFALSVTDAPAELLTSGDPKALLGALKTPADKRSQKQQELLRDEYRGQDKARRALAAAVAKLEAEKKKLDAEGVSSMVMREMPKPRETRLHIRGDFLRKGDPVGKGTPAVFPAMKAPEKDRSRLHLAKWLVREDNPLTARVAVNRIWLHYFGRGLVETENDFGTQGSPPSHPELLDWLASEFMRRGWSLKEMHRLILNSATYRQASKARPELTAVDPKNQLLGRQSRLRVDAEIVRDIALAASGKLSAKIGGPSVRPPQPDGVYNFTQVKKRWDVSPGEDKFRRTMYTFYYRSAAYPMLATFDTPDFSQTCTARIRSNTPLQSLTMANDEGLFELAQEFAARVLRESGKSDDARMTRMFRLALARKPGDGELRRLLEFKEAQRKGFESDTAGASKVAGAAEEFAGNYAEAAAWTATARAVMNLDEFITRE